MTTPPPMMYQHVQVRVPATTANLGSGFDIFGLALHLYNTYTMTIPPIVDESAPEWSVSLPLDSTLPADDTNLVYRAARQLFQRVGTIPKYLHLSLDTQIPLARGLGSSASAIVGGLVAANTLTGSTLDNDILLTMATDIEGHPDNVTPALMGGMTLSYTIGKQYHYIPLPIPDNIQVVVAIPDFTLTTNEARSVLPEHVHRRDAVFNGSRTALLVSALYERRYDLLAVAMDDRLHQPYRTTLVPGLQEAITAGYEARALGVALSGSGPTLMAFANGNGDKVASALANAFKRYQIESKTQVLQVDTAGACRVQPE